VPEVPVEDYATGFLMWTRDGSVLNVEKSREVVFSPQFLKVIADWQRRKEAGEFTFVLQPLWEMVAVKPIEVPDGTLVICNEPTRVVWRLTGERDRGGYVGVWPD
jgi:hypothetical protein